MRLHSTISARLKSSLKKDYDTYGTEKYLYKLGTTFLFEHPAYCDKEFHDD